MSSSSCKIIIYGSDLFRCRQRIQSVASERRYIETSEELESAVANLGQVGLFGDQVTLVFIDLLKHLSPYKQRFFSTSNWIVWERSDKLAFEKAEKKEWEQHSEIMNMKPLSDAEVFAWLTDEAKKRAIAIQKPAIAKLISYHGSNLQALYNDLQKLGHFAKDRDITAKDVEFLSSSSQNEPLFDLIDMVAHKKASPKGKAQLSQLLDGTGDERHVFYMVVKHLRLLLRFKSNRPIDAHPFVQKKIAQQAQLWTLDELLQYMDRLLWIDVASKRGEGDMRELFMLQLLQPLAKDFA